MSAGKVPESFKRKQARDLKLQADEKAAAIKSAKVKLQFLPPRHALFDDFDLQDSEALNKEIFAKAKSYEEEYDKVNR